MWKRLLARFSDRAPDADGKPAHRLRDLYPMLLPKAFAETGAWVGLTETIDAEGLDLSWGVLTPPNWINYLDREMIAFWEGRGLDWRKAAAANIARLASERPWSGHFTDHAERITIVAFLHEDGLGPSRLTVPGLLDEVFPHGYEVAVPELTCAIAIGRFPDAKEDPRAEQIIQSCFAEGTRPVSPKRYPPETFWRL